MSPIFSVVSRVPPLSLLYMQGSQELTIRANICKAYSLYQVCIITENLSHHIWEVKVVITTVFCLSVLRLEGASQWAQGKVGQGTTEVSLVPAYHVVAF